MIVELYIRKLRSNEWGVFFEMFECERFERRVEKCTNKNYFNKALYTLYKDSTLGYVQSNLITFRVDIYNPLLWSTVVIKSNSGTTLHTYQYMPDKEDESKKPNKKKVKTIVRKKTK